jgi:hypothetical protein
MWPRCNVMANDNVGADIAPSQNGDSHPIGHVLWYTNFENFIEEGAVCVVPVWLRRSWRRALSL